MIYRRNRGPRLFGDGWLFAIYAAIGWLIAGWMLWELFGKGSGTVSPDWPGLLLGVIFFAAGGVLMTGLVCGHIRNGRLDALVLGLDRNGIRTPDVFGRVLSFNWDQVLSFDVDVDGGEARPTLLIRTKPGGLGSIELRDINASADAVLAQMEALSGRTRG